MRNTVCLAALLVACVAAQDEESLSPEVQNGLKRYREERRRMIESLSPRAKEVLETFKDDRQKFHRLGELNDPSAIPYLESESDDDAFEQSYGYKRPVPSYARQALARMHVNNYYQGVLDQCVTTLSRNERGSHVHRINAFDALSYIGGRQAIEVVEKYLYDDSDPEDRKMPPNRLLAAQALAGLVPAGPVHKDKIWSNDHVSAWREWWKKNRARYH
jgi:hypothetical protein